MITQEHIDSLVGISKPPAEIISEGPGDPKKKKKESFDFGAEMKLGYNKPLRYDNNKTAVDLVKSATGKIKIDPDFLFTSAYVEGMNKSIFHPDEASEAYVNAKISGEYPVDGFGNYGLDTFGTKFPELVKKGYLPEDFAQRFKPYPAFNEQNEKVTTAAFKNNEDALLAKAAFLRDGMDNVEGYAKEIGVELDSKAKKYFTLASYNGGMGNAKIMMREYAKAKDKKAFIEKGLTSRKGVHVNIEPRMKSMEIASEFFKEPTQSPIQSPSQIITK